MEYEIFRRQLEKLPWLEADGKVYFPASQCIRLLGYKDISKTIRRYCRDIVKGKIQTPGGKQTGNYMAESDVYRLCLHAGPDISQPFTEWLCTEVLPAVRRHGAYVTPEKKQELRRQKAMCTDKEQTPAADAHSRICSVPAARLAKAYGFSTPSFHALLHKLRIQYPVGKTWVLAPQYGDGDYVRLYTYHTPDGQTSVQICWTQKGQAFLYQKLKEHGILPLSREVMPAR